jgi:selenocysteine lyase/cysteine desulfurase
MERPPADYSVFLESHPEYRETEALDALREREYGRLDRERHTYLDYTGGGLYAESQLRAHSELLLKGVFGNPHSASLTSSATTVLVEQARRQVLAYFNAPSSDYVAVFTANASGAIKHVAESFAFGPGGRLLLSFDNHNSINGIREFARRKGAQVQYVRLTAPDLRLDASELARLLTPVDAAQPSLFAYPAQSNFSGVKHPLELVARAKAKGWTVLLDAAAFAPSNRLDVQAVQPDFVCLSFYKMFGYPTGVGCLIARRDALARLTRPWFAGGTVNFASVQASAHRLSPGEAGFEDGTLNYLGIPAVTAGFEHLERVGLGVIATRVSNLTDWLIKGLLDLRHSNGRPMARIYGPVKPVMRGGTVAFNFYDPEGHLLDYRRVEELASNERISLRTGCFCNPGAGESAEGLTEEDMRAGAAMEDISLPRFMQVIQRGGKSAGAMRVSLGIASNFADVDRFLQFAKGFRDQTQLTLGDVTFDIESCRVIRDGS